MHLAERAYALVVITALLAIAGTWASDPAFSGLWRWPAALLLLGLALEGFLVRRTVIRADIETAARALLGREQAAAFAFANESNRSVRLQYATTTPPGFELLGETRIVTATPPGFEARGETRIVTATPPGFEARGQTRIVAATPPGFEARGQTRIVTATSPGFEARDPTRIITTPRQGVGRDPVSLLPVRLGMQRWPNIPARLLGRFGLAWWTRTLTTAREISIAPDTLRAPRRRPSGKSTGMRPRRTVGAGSELHQLRSYVRGDPLARIDWKATARTRRLVTREFSEDQHLDVLVAIDAGRLSRVRAGKLDRFGLYANVAARLAEVVTPNDDRIGLVVFSDRTLAVCAPDRGMSAITRIRRTLERLSVHAAESDPIAAAVRIRSLLKHRTLVVILTDLDDAAVAEQLARAVRLLSPPHLVVVAGAHSVEIADLAKREAQSWRDPWIALAAQEHEARAAAQRTLLRRLGAPVIATREELLEQTVFDEYEALRRSRRV